MYTMSGPSRFSKSSPSETRRGPSQQQVNTPMARVNRYKTQVNPKSLQTGAKSTLSETPGAEHVCLDSEFIFQNVQSQPQADVFRA